MEMHEINNKLKNILQSLTSQDLWKSVNFRILSITISNILLFHEIPPNLKVSQNSLKMDKEKNNGEATVLWISQELLAWSKMHNSVT